MLSETSQRKKYHVISLIYRIKKNKQNPHTKQTNEKTKSKKKYVDTENTE